MSNGVNAIYALDAKTSKDINLERKSKRSELKSTNQVLRCISWVVAKKNKTVWKKIGAKLRIFIF